MRQYILYCYCPLNKNKNEATFMKELHDLKCFHLKHEICRKSILSFSFITNTHFETFYFTLK